MTDDSNTTLKNYFIKKNICESINDDEDEELTDFLIEPPLSCKKSMFSNLKIFEFKNYNKCSKVIQLNLTSAASESSKNLTTTFILLIVQLFFTMLTLLSAFYIHSTISDLYQAIEKDCILLNGLFLYFIKF